MAEIQQHQGWPTGRTDRGVSIAEASRRTGLSRHTLRYYERAGLIEPIERTTSGRRRYNESDLDWFAFLLRLRATGMPIAQMQQYSKLRAGGETSLVTRRRMLAEHKAHVEAEIATLREHLAALEAKIAHYDRELTRAGRSDEPHHADAVTVDGAEPAMTEHEGDT